MQNMRLRLAEDTPVVGYESFDSYVHAAMASRDEYHRIMSEELRAEKWKHVHWGANCTLSRTYREGVNALLMAVTPSAIAWAHNANDFIVFSLRITMTSYLMHTDKTRSELEEFMHTNLDLLLGYPDCCWGWRGPGILRDLLQTSFHTLVSSQVVSLIPKSQWPQHTIAFLMTNHPRLGSNSPLHSCDRDLLHVILCMVIAPRASQVHISLL